MVEELDMNNDPLVSPAMGWMQMQLLLDKNLPVKKRSTIHGFIYSWLPSFLLFTVFIFSSLKLDTDLFTALITNRTTPKISPGYNASFTGTGYLLSKPKTIIHHTAVDKSKYATFTETSKDETTITNDDDNGAILPVMNVTSIRNTIKEILVNRNRIGITGLTAKKILAISSEEIAFLKKQQPKSPPELYAGAGINIATGNSQNLQPYPIAELKYHITPRLFIAAGLSLFSPAPASISGVSKTVYVNDTVNNISLYNEVVNYDHFRYADIPLSVGLNISKKISVQTGVQLSILMNKTAKTKLQSYDFLMNDRNVPAYTPQGMAAPSQQNFDVNVKNSDYRFVAGIKYKQSKMIAGLLYQHRLELPGAGLNTTATKNHLFTLSLLYKIK